MADLTPPPHIVLIITDQQRLDTIAALGASGYQTPHLDRLCREGVAFTQCHTPSPVCCAARASLFRGQYPHTTGVYTNFEPWSPTWVSSLADAGYHCVNIGKMHTNPYDAPGGFHQRLVVENKDRPLFLDEHPRAWHDEWDKALRARKRVKPSRYTRAAADAAGFRDALGCFTWELDNDLHPDTFVGETACWWLRERQATSPLFLQIGFPGPHPPYDPTAEDLARFADTRFDVPQVSADELDMQPPLHAGIRGSMSTFNVDSVAWRPDATPDDLLRLRRHYAANVWMIDRQVGAILQALDDRGMSDNTVLLFCSDHGDALGEHGHIQKWTMYDAVTRVPCIAWAPGRIPATAPDDALVQLHDLAPTVLDFAGVPVPAHWQSRSMHARLTTGAWPADAPPREAVYAELSRDHLQTAVEYVLMRRDRRWKLVLYPGTDDGELYDLSSDPHERHNLWRDPAHAGRIADLKHEALTWRTLSHHRATRRPTPRPQQPMKLPSAKG